MLFVTLRTGIAPLAAGLCLLVMQPVNGQQFPYTGQVTAETPYYGKAEVNGSPAGQLPSGSSLEVYRHDGDWLAIRPPAGSFSWVSTRDVEPTSQPGIVRVRTSAATCWIGHAGSDSRTLSQVTLDQGELLQVLGDSLVGDENEVRQWYRIAPPAGEFRFVHSRHIHGGTATFEEQEPIGTGVRTLAAGWSTRNQTSVAPVPTSSTNVSVAAMPTHVAPPIQTSSTQAMPVTPVAHAVATAPIMQASAAPATTEAAARERLAIIDGQLAAMLAYPPNMWNPMAVVPELQTLTASAPTADLRAQAQALWTQAIKSQQVQQGYAQVASGVQTSVQPAVAHVPAALQQSASSQALPQSTARPASYYVETPSPYSQGPLHVSPEFRPLAPRNLLAKFRQATFNVADAVQDGAAAEYGRGDGSPTLATNSEPEILDWPVDENGHAGTGWLMPLVARSQLPLESRAGVPPLALTDDDGNVKFLVTPSSGTNLSEYLRKEVGIVGPVSKLPDIEAPHISAQRVVVLERHE